jgi:ribosomal protein S18 acetylase RimI-like enzyme
VRIPIEIVPRAEADVRLLFALAKSTFDGISGWEDSRVLRTLARDVVFVAREKGLPAGYVALRPDDEGIVVEQLFVAPGHEQHGVGRSLLAYAEGYAIAQRASTLRIVVEQENLRARSFYRREGFVPVAPELVERILPRDS